MKKYIAIYSAIGLVICLFVVAWVHASFTSGALNTNNSFTAAAVFPTATPSTTPTPTTGPTPTPTPITTPTPTPSSPQAGDVVINELMWPGSSKGTSDEWIELRNTTSHTIDISNWQITKWLTSLGGHEALMLTIPSGKTITAGGLFLIADKSPGVGTALTVMPDVIDSAVSLDNSNLQVRLFVSNWDTGGLLIDTAGNKNTPLAGSHVNSNTFFSMERNATPGDGSLASSWHTATTSVNLNSDSNQNKGTPKAAND